MAQPRDPDDRARSPTAKRIAAIPFRAPPAARDPSDHVQLGRREATLRTGDHVALIYWSREELLRTAVPYLAEGIKANDKVVYVADDLPTELIEARLRAEGVDVARETASGRLTVVKSADAFFDGGRFDVETALAGVRRAADAALGEGYRRLRFSVEMTYLLADKPGIERGIEFESRANEEIFAQLPFVCVCSFNGAREVNDIVGDVLRTHPVLLRDGHPLANPYYRPWAELRTG